MNGRNNCNRRLTEHTPSIIQCNKKNYKKITPQTQRRGTTVNGLSRNKFNSL